MRAVAKGLYLRFQVLVHEMAKFGVVGAINTGVHVGLFGLLHWRLGLGPLTSNGLAIAVAATSSYFMNRHWTFRHRARTGAGREYSLFFLLNGVGWLISQACVGFTAYVLGFTGPIADFSALVAGVALGMGFRFATYKRWVFLPAEAEPVPGGGATVLPVAPPGRAPRRAARGRRLAGAAAGTAPGRTPAPVAGKASRNGDPAAEPAEEAGATPVGTG